MAHSPHKRFKGCCAMCGWHTVRGQGYGKRLPARDLRKLGGRKKDRVTRHGRLQDDD